MSEITAPAGELVLPHSYDDFQGIDSSRDVASLDTGERQFLYSLTNGYANFRGIILRDRGVKQRATTPGDRLIHHVAFFGSDLIAWAQRDGGGITLKAEPNGTEAIEVYTKNSIISSTVFNNKLVFFSRDQQVYTYDGFAFTASTNTKDKPAFGVAIQRRLAIAGGVGRQTIVDLSRVDDMTVFTQDEPDGGTEVTKAADIDISNIIGSNDEITGLGVFEKSKLAVFTKDQAVVYKISPDFTKWAIDENASVNIGCVSHNTIASVGTDLIFCSRSGVHSLRRSEANGITIYAVNLSSNIEELYKKLFRTVANPKDISGFYDQDLGQYHVYFPQNDQTCVRLTMTISPSPDVPSKWSTSTFLNQRCGASLGGITCYGTSGGVFDVVEYEDDTTADIIPDMEIVTPILWHGSITETKQTREFILQASGRGRIKIEAFKSTGELMASYTVDLDGPEEGDDDRTFLPLSKQYNRPFVHQYKGVQFKITTIGGTGRIKIIGLAVLVDVTKQQLQQRGR